MDSTKTPAECSGTTHGSLSIVIRESDAEHWRNALYEGPECEHCERLRAAIDEANERHGLRMPHFADSCVCGGIKSQPNADCERCSLISELELARSVLLRIAYPQRGTADESMDIFAASQLAATVVDRPE